MSKRALWILVAVLAVTWAAIGWLAFNAETSVAVLGLPKQRFSHVVTEQLTVKGGGTTIQSDVTATGYDITVDDVTADDITSTGAFSITGEITDTGKVLINGVPDADANNYDYWVEITGNMTGRTTKDRNYGLLIEMTRPAGQEVDAGDFDEAGLKIRVDTEAVTTTAGTVLRGADIEAKADNPSGTVTNLYGVAATAKSDTSAGSVANMVALTANSQANAEVTDSMMAADLRLFRQSANEPTAEYVMQVRNSSTTGSGADAGIYLTSDYGSSSTTDSMDYGIDMTGAAVNTAELRLSNDALISNLTAGTVNIGAGLTITGGVSMVGNVTAQRAIITDTVSAAGFTGPITATQVILGGTLTGLRYGMAAAVTDGVTITHGLGAAPLFVMITPYGDGITVTANVAVSDTTSFTVDVPDGVTLANLGWFAGK